MNRDHVDEAIDQVAAQLTRVDDSPEFARRLVASLPERVTWFGWLTHSWAPRLAVAVVLAVVLTYVRTGVQPDVATNVQTNVRTDVPTNVPTNVQTDVRPVVPPTVQANDRMNARRNDRQNARVNDRLNEPDFERSLAALEDVESLTPVDLPNQRSIELAPLTLAELPLTGETFPAVGQRYEE